MKNIKKNYLCKNALLVSIPIKHCLLIKVRESIYHDCTGYQQGTDWPRPEPYTNTQVGKGGGEGVLKGGNEIIHIHTEGIQFSSYGSERGIIKKD